MLVRQARAKPINTWDFKSFKGNYPYSPATQPVSLKSAEVYDSPCAWGISPRSSPHAANNLQNQGDSQMSLWELNHSRAILAELIERHLRHLNTDLFPFLFLNVHMQYSLFMWKNKSSCIKVRCHGTHTLFPSFVMFSGFSRELPWGVHMAAGVQTLSCYLSNKKTSVTSKIIYDNNMLSNHKKLVF